MTISSTRDHRASMRLRPCSRCASTSWLTRASGGRKTHSSTLTTGGDRQAGSKMALAGAGVTDQQDRLGAFEIAAFGQGTDAGSRDV